MLVRDLVHDEKRSNSRYDLTATVGRLHHQRVRVGNTAFGRIVG
jgi:hypothetical protein